MAKLCCRRVKTVCVLAAKLGNHNSTVAEAENSSYCVDEKLCCICLRVLLRVGVNSGLRSDMVWRFLSGDSPVALASLIGRLVDDASSAESGEKFTDVKV